MARKIAQRHQNKPRPPVKIKIRREDTVRVIAGKDKGKTGRVLQVDSEHGKVLVEGMGMVKRHTRPDPAHQIQGGIAERESLIAISNVTLLTSGGVPTRVGFRVEGTGASSRRVRFARKTGEILEKKA